MDDIREQLVTELEEAHQVVKTLVDELDRKREIYPGWKSKEFLAHLTGWDEASVASLRAHSLGNEPGTPAYRGIDYYNEQSVAERVSLEYPQVYHEWEMARAAFKKAVRDVPLERLHEPMLMPWGQTGSVKVIVGIMVHHGHEHAEDLRHLLATGAVIPAPPSALMNVEKPAESTPDETPKPTDAP